MRVTRANYPKLRDAFALVEQFLGVPSAAAADGGFDVPDSIGAKRLVAAEQSLAKLTPGGLTVVCGAGAGGRPVKHPDLAAVESLLKQFAEGW